MPYTWTNKSDSSGARHKSLVLWPFRSLPKRGFAVVILLVFALITVPLYPLLGTVLVWGMLPFMLATLGALWWGLQRSYRSGEILEVLELSPETLHLSHTNAKGQTSEWQANPYWVRAEMHLTGGPVPHYITLSGKGRMVELGSFLSEEERKALFAELTAALNEMRQAAGPQG